MKSIQHFLQLPPLPMKPREGRMAPARSVRLLQAAQQAFRYDETRWGDLPPGIANAYARFEDKSKQAIRERSLI